MSWFLDILYLIFYALCLHIYSLWTIFYSGLSVLQINWDIIYLDYLMLVNNFLAFLLHLEHENA